MDDSVGPAVRSLVDAIGVMALSGNDEVFVIPDMFRLRRMRISPSPRGDWPLVKQSEIDY